jgi:hypothetical protein
MNLVAEKKLSVLRTEAEVNAKDFPTYQRKEQWKAGIVKIKIIAADSDPKKSDVSWYWELVGNDMLVYDKGDLGFMSVSSRNYIKREHARIIQSKEIHEKYLSK